MNQQNFFLSQNDDGRNQRIDKGMRELQEVAEIIDIAFKNNLENLKNSFITTERQKLTRIVGSQANIMIQALKTGLSFYFKDVSIGEIPILDVYIDVKEYEQCMEKLKV
jgi:hypothetical protein